MSQFLDLIAASKNPVLFDGAMGTQLNARGADFTRCLDELNLTNPALVAEIHRDYINAGAQVTMTNTFSANRFKLREHGLDDKVHEINKAGVLLAKRAVQASYKDVLVAGDIGPLGVRLAPFGRVQPEEARAAFREQIQGLVDGGADLLVIETMTDLYEIQEAVKAAREVTDLPVLASMAYTRDDRTILGDSPSKVAKALHEAGADVIGVNCSGGPSQILRILKEMKAVVSEGKFSAVPNAGWPENVGGRIMYPAGPDYFGDYALAFRQAGASVIGGCCGTTPSHISAMSKALERSPDEAFEGGFAIRVAERQPSERAPEKTSQLKARLDAHTFSIAVEMSPPRGLSTHKLHAAAGMLADVGANVINVADSPRARMRMSPWAVCEIVQRTIGVETTLHFPTRGRNLLRLQGDLLAAHAIGVRNVFVVMGDPTEIGDYPEAMDNYDLVPTGLIKLIQEGFNAGVDAAGEEIGEPTHFFVGAALNLTPKDAEREIKVLRKKLVNGADFFLTQPVFQPDEARAFLAQCRDEIEGFDQPVLMGVLPLYGARHARFLHNEVPGIHIAESVLDQLEAAGDEGTKLGIQHAVELVEGLKDVTQGIYIMPPFGRYEMAAEIIENVKVD